MVSLGEEIQGDTRLVGDIHDRERDGVTMDEDCQTEEVVSPNQ